MFFIYLLFVFSSVITLCLSHFNMVISLERSQTRQEHKHQTGKQNPEVTYSTWVKRKSKVTVIKSSQFRDPFPVLTQTYVTFCNILCNKAGLATLTGAPTCQVHCVAIDRKSVV